MKHRRQGEGLARVGPVAKGAVHLIEQGLAKTAGQAGAWQLAQLTQAAQAHAQHGLGMRLPCHQQPDGRRLQRATQGRPVGAVQAVMPP